MLCTKQNCSSIMQDDARCSRMLQQDATELLLLLLLEALGGALQPAEGCGAPGPLHAAAALHRPPARALHARIRVISDCHPSEGSVENK
jgi:hypothetical protein